MLPHSTRPDSALIYHVWNKHAAVNMTLISKKPEYLVFSINRFSYWPAFSFRDTRGKKQDEERDHKERYHSVGATESILSCNKTQYIAALIICSHFYSDVCTFGRLARTRTFNTITCREGSNKRHFGLKCLQLSLIKKTLKESAVVGLLPACLQITLSLCSSQGVHFCIISVRSKDHNCLKL